MAPEFPSTRASRLRVAVELKRWRRMVATRTHRDNNRGSALKSASHEGKGKGPAPAGGGSATVDPVRGGVAGSVGAISPHRGMSGNTSAGIGLEEKRVGILAGSGRGGVFFGSSVGSARGCLASGALAGGTSEGGAAADAAVGGSAPEGAGSGGSDGGASAGGALAGGDGGGSPGAGARRGGLVGGASADVDAAVADGGSSPGAGARRGGLLGGASAVGGAADGASAVVNGGGSLGAGVRRGGLLGGASAGGGWVSGRHRGRGKGPARKGILAVAAVKTQRPAKGSPEGETCAVGRLLGRWRPWCQEMLLLRAEAEADVCHDADCAGTSRAARA